MNKTILILFLFILLISCGKKSDPKYNASNINKMIKKIQTL